MVSFRTACEIAVDYFKNKQGKAGICQALDAGNVWIFFGGSEEEVTIGAIDITVNKMNGVVESFILPSQVNFDLMNNAVEMEVPHEFLGE